jgi:hypothetical protein
MYVLEYDFYFVSGNMKGTWGTGRMSFLDAKTRKEFILEKQCRIISEPYGNSSKILGNFKLITN